MLLGSSTAEGLEERYIEYLWNARSGKGLAVRKKGEEPLGTTRFR